MNNQSIYKNYAQNISEALKNGRKRGQIVKGFTGLGDIEPRAEFRFSQNLDQQMFESLSALSNYSGIKAKYQEKPGQHPDFINIKNLNTTENHYIVSMFIDIKNSTQLFKKYYPETVVNITNTIQRAAVHTCWYFNGFVQRFHGDGLLIYFGGRNMNISTAVDNAINAASFFTYFVQNDIKDLFTEQGVEKIFTRIGIDTGESEDVLWYLAGMGDCSEVTTCSLHTSLAYKMQTYAASNGIMVGDNIKKHSSINSELFFVKNEQNRYIFQITDENFNYTQWDLNWQKYLKQRFKTNEDFNLIITNEIFSNEGSQNTLPPLELNLNTRASEPFIPNKPWLVK